MLASASAVFGCGISPGHSGIRRWSVIRTIPAISCIESAIRSVDAVKSVRIEAEELSAISTMSCNLPGLSSPGTDEYTIVYAVSETEAVMHIVPTCVGDFDFEQTSYNFGYQSPSQANIDIIRPVMIQIELALEQQCGVESLSLSIVEICETDISCTAE